MKSFLRNQLKKIGYQFNRIDAIELRGKEIFKKYEAYTMVPERLYIANLRLANDFSHVEGCIVECGVWRGGMIAGIAEILNDRMFYLFDSFQGLPEAKEIDGEKAIAWQKNTEGKSYHNNCTAEIHFAEEVMNHSGARHRLIQGWFSETLPVSGLESPIAILRLDGDWYDSIRDCLNNLYPQVMKGGIIIIDDYYTWDGCSRAVHDYLSGIKSTSRIYRTPEGVPYIIKAE